MSEEKDKNLQEQEEKKEEVIKDETSDKDAKKEETPKKEKSVISDRKEIKKNPHKKNERPRRGRRPQRERREFDQKIISIRRVTRVMAGGRRFSFSVAIVIGDRKGKVGVGVGKAGDTALAIEKAIRDAKKSMITVKQTKDGSIAHDISAKYCASVVSILPAPGRGVVAGGAVRTVLELAGVKDVTSKIFSRSKNHLNNANAAIKALKSLNK